MKLRKSIGYNRLFITPFVRVDSWSKAFKHFSFGWLKWSFDLWFAKEIKAKP